MTIPPLTRRRFQLGAVAVAVSLLASGCGAAGGSGGTDGNKEVTLRFAWWGNEYLNSQTEKVIDAFEAANPTIKIESEPGEWSSYWDKLATKTAANDAPDVIQMDQKYIAEYGGRGALLDLAKQEGIDTSKLAEEALASGQYDGAQYGLSTGQNAYVVMANTKVFEAANVPLPDDTTWTWDDFVETAAKISASGDGSTYGAAYGSNEADLIIWLRQHGQNLYSEDGKLDFDTATAASFWERLKEQRDSKASPPATVATEDAGAGLEESLFGTNRVGMAWWWTNQLGSLEATTGNSIKMLRAPSADGTAAENGMYYKPTMFWSASSRTKHPEATAKFIDFLTNSPEAGAILMTDRGVPTNTEIVESITPSLKPADTTVVSFLKDIEPDMKEAPPVPPVGAGSVQNVIKRYTDEVLYDRLTPQAAAEAFKKEVEGMISSASK
ncbi:sugar ABC transporter substrate-binding protein [Pseudarthrobacter sp. J75]|uniref:ABC transporter substrate-binding protein n=1 Tax=unclassified Pseudarthrobacter TaxID=2647000 RepID=UPI002E821CDB|nr:MULTISPECIES: sugar ABC transporter substrate-binding protein [unclassified Pseudarthrobacter]MEE2523193.1 sugar ABC transporter substrate-binding protein [Pseudarthrobacter sp. J47]MEE2527448.1 sugar ABC transporter substrate-binding protein [Pseudarthrobacter sp. J75]